MYRVCIMYICTSRGSTFTSTCILNKKYDICCDLLQSTLWCDALQIADNLLTPTIVSVYAPILHDRYTPEVNKATEIKH